MFSKNSSYKLIEFEEAFSLAEGKRHVAHCGIFSRTSTPMFKQYVCSSLINMQMRHDGRLGFPGGVIDETGGRAGIVEGLNRELREEINLDEKYFVSDDDYLCSHFKADSKFPCVHFYTKEVSKEDFDGIERRIFDARDYGKETMGIVRVPMLTMDDEGSGLPTFLCNEFAGNAKEQLLNLISRQGLMSSEELAVAVERSQSLNS